MSDIWTRHKSLFRKLYQEERQPLSKVKEIVEREPHNFPEHRLSTYEAKLRDVLQLRKKLKKDDWKAIHQYALSLGYPQGGYKVFLNNTLLSQRKVWKEIRRNNFHKGRSDQSLDGTTMSPSKSPAVAHSITLPTDVKVVSLRGSDRNRARLPTAAENSSPTAQEIVSHHDGPPGDGNRQNPASLSSKLCTAFLATTSSSLDCANSNMYGFQISDRHETIRRIDFFHNFLPWNEFREIILALLFKSPAVTRSRDVDGLVFSYIPNDGFLPFTPSFALARLADTAYPTPQSIFPACLPSPTSLSTQLLWYQQFSSLTYLLSNNLSSNRSQADANFKGFGFMLSHLPIEVTLQHSYKQSCSLRAVWESFLDWGVQIAVYDGLNARGADEASFSSTCSIIIKFILQLHADWIRGAEDRLLFLCAATGNAALVKRLLHHGAQATYFENGRSTISEAARAGITESIRPMLDTVDMNSNGFYVTVWERSAKRQRPDALELLVTRFAGFLWTMMSSSQKPKSNFVRALEVLLTAGCDVDVPYPSRLYSFDEDFSQIADSSPWPPSCLDIAYYLHAEAYAMMRAYSKEIESIPSRQGVCTAAEAGQPALVDYISRFTALTSTQHRQFLDAALLEQFFVKRHYRFANLDARSARTAIILLKHGARLQGLQSGAVEVWVRSVLEYGLTDDLQAILACLHGPVDVDTETEILKQCVTEGSTEMLSLLMNQGLLQLGHLDLTMRAEILLEAAVAEAYGAVSWLSSKGFDITADSEDYGRDLLGICFHDQVPLSMCRYLAHAGARLRLYTYDQTSANLLLLGLTQGFCADRIVAIWEFFKEFPEDLDQITKSEWGDILHVTCSSLIWRSSADLAQVSDQLLQKYLKSGGRPTLALPIAGHRQFTLQTLVHDGAGVDEKFGPWGNHSAYSPLHLPALWQDLTSVQFLVQNRAGINAIFPRPLYDFTSVLGRACQRTSASTAEKRSQIELVKFLIDHGANVGESYVESARSWPWFQSPLQLCVEHGALEAASLLLQKGADPNLVRVHSLRWTRWNHSTETALDIAVHCGHLDLTQLLLKAGGLSAELGVTGYDGAIQLAIDYRRHALRDLIQQHVQSNAKLFAQCSEFQLNHQALIEGVKAMETKAAHLAEVEEVNWARPAEED